MEDADRRIERGDLDHLGSPDREEVADEHRAHVLGAVRRAIREEHGGCGRDGIDDADHGLLGHVTPPATRQREHQRPDERSGEAERVRLPGVGLPAEEERRRRAEGGDLRERDVHEDDLAGEDVDAEIGVDAGEHQAHEERRPQEREELAGHAI